MDSVATTAADHLVLQCWLQQESRLAVRPWGAHLSHRFTLYSLYSKPNPFFQGWWRLVPWRSMPCTASTASMHVQPAMAFKQNTGAAWDMCRSASCLWYSGLGKDFSAEAPCSFPGSVLRKWELHPALLPVTPQLFLLFSLPQWSQATHF